MGFIDRIRNQGAPATPIEADRLAVRQLEGLGADLARPRHVVHFLSTTDEGAAHASAEAASELGYDVSIVASREGDDEWTVRATAERVIHASTIAAFRASFERVAEETGTTYEGWEASPKP